MWWHLWQKIIHCCLAPCKSVPNYGPLTEPKICIVKFGRTAIPTLNGRISKTKRDFLDPLVPKFSYDRGLSPTLSWKWPSATLAPSFGLFQSEKNTFLGMVYIFILQKISPERDRLQHFVHLLLFWQNFLYKCHQKILRQIWVVTNSKSAENITSWVYWKRNRSLLLKTFCTLFNQLAILTYSAVVTVTWAE